MLRKKWIVGLLTLMGSAAYAQQCGTVDASNLNITASCLNLGGTLYSLQLKAQSNTSGLFWTYTSAGAGTSSSYCAQIDGSLNLTFPCLSAAGLNISATLKAVADTAQPLGLKWQLSAYQPITVTTTPGTTAKAWTTYTHPCNENRTDAFWWDDDKTAWAGCGTGTVGRGLWQSKDGGKTWGQITGYFETWRVQDIRRSADGLLYVSGTDTASKEAVVSINTTTTPFTVKNVFTSTNNVDLSMQVEHFVRDSQGRAFGDSLTGSGSIYRASDTSAWQGLYTSWAEDGKSYQIMAMTQFNDKTYASGSTISQPPYVFLPSQKAGAEPYKLTPVQLSTRFTGEMWGITVLDEKRVVVVGVDQGRDVGMIFASKTNPYDAADYSQFDVSTLITNKSTWMRGVCSKGDTVVAVGEKQPLASGTGIVLLSSDGGKTFTNITDPLIKANTVSRCTILSNGAIAVAGSGGYVGIYQ